MLSGISVFAHGFLTVQVLVALVLGCLIIPTLNSLGNSIEARKKRHAMKLIEQKIQRGELQEVPVKRCEKCGQDLPRQTNYRETYHGI
jgi:hypothetical protein